MLPSFFLKVEFFFHLLLYERIFGYFILWVDSFTDLTASESCPIKVSLLNSVSRCRGVAEKKIRRGGGGLSDRISLVCNQVSVIKIASSQTSVDQWK